MNLIAGQLIGAKEAPRLKPSSRSLETLIGAHLSRIEAVSTRKHANAVHLRGNKLSLRPELHVSFPPRWPRQHTYDVDVWCWTRPQGLKSSPRHGSWAHRHSGRMAGEARLPIVGIRRRTQQEGPVQSGPIVTPLRLGVA